MIKVFSIMTLQHLVQTNLANFLAKTRWVKDSVKESYMPLVISVTLFLINFVVSSIFSEKLRDHPAVNIIMLILVSFSWSMLIIVGCIMQFEHAAELAVTISVM